MKEIEYIVPHCENSRPVVAKGYVQGDYFHGEYRINKMTYGCSFKLNFTSFLKETPKERTPLIVRFQDGQIDHAYYIEWSNTINARSLVGRPVAKEWCYRNYNFDLPSNGVK